MHRRRARAKDLLDWNYRSRRRTFEGKLHVGCYESTELRGAEDHRNGANVGEPCLEGWVLLSLHWLSTRKEAGLPEWFSQLPRGLAVNAAPRFTPRPRSR